MSGLQWPWRQAARLPFARPLQIACVVLPALLFCGLAWVDYRIETGRARDSVAMTTDALAEHARTVVQTIDLVLGRVLDHIDGKDWDTLAASPETHAFLAALQRELPQVESVFLVDPQGINVASSRVYPMPRFDVHTREYFTAAAGKNTDSFVVSAPFRGAIAGTYAFTMSRSRIRDGHFDGVVGVTVSPRYFEGFYRVILHHPIASVAALVRTDGALLVRFPESGDRPLQLEAATSPLLRAAASGATFGLFLGHSTVDGQERLGGYERLPELPLLVNYGLDRSVYLESWRLHAMVLALGAVLLSALLLVTEHMVWRKSTRDHETLRRLVEETERRRQAEAVAQQSQKMEAVGRLTGGVAHDFNNLLAAILGSLELVLRRESDPRSIRMLRTAFEAAQRGARLTAQMLSFARKHEVAVRSVDVNAVIEGMEDLLRRTLGPLVRLQYDLAPGLWPVLADPAQLELALVNLAVNARDAMPDGGELTFGTNRITDPPSNGAEAGLDAGDYACITVTDSGTGMSEEVRRRALEPFYTTKPPGSGTGLGLSMVYGFVTELGGALRLDSTPGQGTCVRLFLRKADRAPVAERPSPVVDVPTGRAGRILLVDDDPEVRASVRAILDDLGHTVIDAAGAREALDTLAQDQGFDLLIVDFAMPGMNGSEFAAEVKTFWPNAPILFVSGYVENDALRPWSKLGYRTLSKPFPASELAAAVQSTMRRSATAAL